MKPTLSVFAGLAAGVVVAAAGYATWVAMTWVRFGHLAKAASEEERDPLLDHFMPEYDVVERHHIRVQAPVELTFAAAAAMDVEQSAVARAIFKTRAWFMRSGRYNSPARRRSFVDQMQAFGWGVLAEIPGREIVMGGVTQPWKAKPVFTALAPEAFAAYREPDQVKIIFTIRADPRGPDQSVFRSETRAVATDYTARAKFRRYWSLVSPGVSVIRWLMLQPIKSDAEHRARAARRHSPTAASVPRASSPGHNRWEHPATGE